jgi:hypothetical protein
MMQHAGWNGAANLRLFWPIGSNRLTRSNQSVLDSRELRALLRFSTLTHDLFGAPFICAM